MYQDNYNQYGQHYGQGYDGSYERSSRTSLGSLAIEGALVLGAVLAILYGAQHCSFSPLNKDGNNKHLSTSHYDDSTKLTHPPRTPRLSAPAQQTLSTDSIDAKLFVP